jgi:hypothetical protein
MRKPIIALLVLAVGALMFAGAVSAQVSERPSRAMRAAVREAIVPRGCQTVTVTGFASARVQLFDMQQHPVGSATRAELGPITSALFCDSEPQHARVQTALGQRLVLRSALRMAQAAVIAPRAPQAEIPSRHIEVPQPSRSESAARVERQVTPPSSANTRSIQAPPAKTAAPRNQVARESMRAPSVATNGAAPTITTQQHTTSLAINRELVAVVVEIGPDQARDARNGGSAAAILADPSSSVGANKNSLLCEGLFRTFEQATSEEAQVGARIGAEGDLEMLRPIYWLAQTVTEGQPGAEACPQRLESFDYPRSARLARKLGLVGAGPYLVVERHDLFENERVAAVIDLSRTPPGEIINAVRYFREGFAQVGDVWAPQRYERTRARDDLIAFMNNNGEGASASASGGDFGFLPRLIHATRQVGCPLTNLLDVCSN